MAKILIVEDEPDILELLSYNLRQAGYEVFTAAEGEEGLRLAEEQIPDLVVLDLMLPGMDGLELCRLLKQRESLRRVPVLMLTAKAEEVDRIVGLELGADDYVTKPFSPRELVLRIKAILRRGTAKPEEDEVEGRIAIGPLVIDPTAHQVQVASRTVDLTATEFRLLHTLAQRRGRVQTRDELLEVVWGYQYSGYGRTVDTHIRRLREKLGEACDWVETVRGVGYRFRREPG
ncbi:MAG: response regulator transcription factor [Candidatus Latescibacteria bacterium]|nr:response regulator transcription factor [Candidatus Latescibacterota bacterium]